MPRNRSRTNGRHALGKGLPCYPAAGCEEEDQRGIDAADFHLEVRRRSILQKFLAASLAIPVLVMVYMRTLIGGVGRRPILIAAAALAVTAGIAAAMTQPTPASGKLPSAPGVLEAAEFAPFIRTSESPSAEITITFPAAMNASSVERLLRVDPSAAIETSWDATETMLTIKPRTSWTAATIHTITVEAGALDANGRPLDHRVRAAFLTREAFAASISPTESVGAEALVTTHFRVEFAGVVDIASIALAIDPSVEGQIGPAADSSSESTVLEFVPTNPLAAGQAYSVSLAPGARDVEGGRIDAASVVIKTAAPPSVVRFRPVIGATSVGWSQNLSVRFTEPMDRASTEAAWSVTQDGKAVAGVTSWAENDTVLVFNPSAVLGYSQKVVMGLATTAASRIGLPLESATSAAFTTAPRPAPKPVTRTGGSGGSIGGSTWAAVEGYYLKLMNCTRTGGLVTSTGACSSPGGRSVAALWQDSGISSKVSRPYAKKLAVNNICSHYSGGTPGSRLSAAGYKNYVWAENLGCRSGNPYAAVLASHLYFQSERSYGGGHYVNLMNAAYDRVGIGVWVSGGRVRLVVDFYRPG
ncbi:MAG: Ig-like domain-containing protein [Chloroflexota bacterium]